MKYIVPSIGEIELKTLILDLNGTLTVKGKIVSGVKPRLTQLKEMGYEILFFTGNTRNNADSIADQLGIRWILAETGRDKKIAAEKLNPESCVSIGNGLIDLELAKVVKLAIVVMQAEGFHVQTFLNSHVAVPTIIDALDMLIEPATLIATLRK